MTAYQPAWRRPIARAFRLTARAPVRWCVRLSVHHNAASAAARCFWRAGEAPWLLD
jgi:hypothetical protein